jgi:L-threonate 2-dehydrogenase
MTKTVGIIGLGIMGGAMANNLRASGFDVVGYDVDADAIAAAKSAGVQIADSAAAVATRAEKILISLPSAKAVLDTATAIAQQPAKHRIVAETSTLSLADKTTFSATLSDAGHVALDSPLSGTGAQAKTKDLVVFASGDAAAIAQFDAIFHGFARKIFNLGAYGNGSKMKFVANHLVAIHNVASAEAMVLGMKAGLDPKQIVEVVSSGAGNSRVLELRGPMMAANTYLPATMRLRTWKKDMAVIGAFASSYDCPTPLFNATEGIYDAALSMGHGADDAAAVCAVLELMAGLKREPH